MKQLNRYGRVDQLLHKLAFSTESIQMLFADVEEYLYKQKYQDIVNESPVFVSSVPRSGTTILLELLSSTKAFAFHSYRNMPFLLAPIIWKKLAFTEKEGIISNEHGDILINSLGFRGPYFEIERDPGIFRIVTMGGSTTAGMYVVAQLVGGVVAGGILFFIFGEGSMGGTPAPGVLEGVTITSSKVVVIEIALTFLLMFAIMGTAVDSRAPAIGGWGIGLMVAADIMMGGPLTGAAMNPARHFGTALFEGLLTDAWMYWVGPIVGAGLCAMLYERFLMADE